MHKSLHLLLYCLNTIYWEGKKGGIQKNSKKNLELDAQHYAPCTLNCMHVCMNFIACYYELFNMNCNFM